MVTRHSFMVGMPELTQRPMNAHIPADADSLSFECIPYLRAVLESSQSSGTRIRVLILCNPHNPLADAYPVETTLAYARLAEEVQ